MTRGLVVVQFEENLEQWPHLNELVHCYTTDWVKDENKYGHYDSVGTPSFHNQIYEGPDTDIETGICFSLYFSFSFQIIFIMYDYLLPFIFLLASALCDFCFSIFGNSEWALNVIVVN